MAEAPHRFLVRLLPEELPGAAGAEPQGGRGGEQEQSAVARAVHGKTRATTEDRNNRYARYRQQGLRRFSKAPNVGDRLCRMGKPGSLGNHNRVSGVTQAVRTG